MVLESGSSERKRHAAAEVMPVQGGFYQAPVSKAGLALTVGASLLVRVLLAPQAFV